MSKNSFARLTLLSAIATLSAHANFEKDRGTILKQAGCYIVDYRFQETKSLKEGYVIDPRVYDTNSRMTTYELIVPIEKSPNEIRMQHILFAKDLEKNEVMPYSMLKHQAEDWEYEANFAFDFATTSLWNSLHIAEPAGKWLRKVTALDDGLRYQCAAAWDYSKGDPEWKCSNFAPIPGREFRDMGRKDYQAMDRTTQILASSTENSWLERQDNVKTILNGSERIPLARELGRTIFLKKGDEACADARKLFEERKDFWNILMGVWEEYLNTEVAFQEIPRIEDSTRYGEILGVEDKYYSLVANDASAVENAKTEIRSIINKFRKVIP